MNLFNWIDKLYSIQANSNIRFLFKFRFLQSMIWHAGRISTDLLINKTPECQKKEFEDAINFFENNSNIESDLAITLTSFPARINNIWLVLVSLFRQSRRPQTIYLWLSKEQFESEKSLPELLLLVKSKDFEIKFVDGDCRSYKKYQYIPDHTTFERFVIVDDDIYYPSDMLDRLLKIYKKYPKTIVANRSKRIGNEVIYKSWLNPKQHTVTSGFDIIATGCGGVLYDTSLIAPFAFEPKLYTELAPTGDDIWLNVASYLMRTKVTTTQAYPQLFPVAFDHSNTLNSENNGCISKNDLQLLKVREHFLTDSNIDVFSRSNQSSIQEGDSIKY